MGQIEVGWDISERKDPIFHEQIFVIPLIMIFRILRGIQAFITKSHLSTSLQILITPDRTFVEKNAWWLGPWDSEWPVLSFPNWWQIRLTEPLQHHVTSIRGLQDREQAQNNVLRQHASLPGVKFGKQR